MLENITEKTHGDDYKVHRDEVYNAAIKKKAGKLTADDILNTYKLTPKEAAQLNGLFSRNVPLKKLWREGLKGILER